MSGPLTSIAITQCLRGLPPGAAGDAAYRLFCTPVLSERRDPKYRMLSASARFHLRTAIWRRLPTFCGDLQTYSFEPDAATVKGTVLLVHGWTSEAAFMTALAEPIRRAGFRVVMFDFPAHGLSPGRRTNLMECAQATLVVAEAMGPVDAIVAHSFGGLCALLAIEGVPPMPKSLAVGQLVLIACPNRLSDVTREFAELRQMTDAGRKAFERRLERVGWRSLDRFSTASLLRTVGCRALVVHAHDDAEVPFSCALEIVAAHGTAKLAAFDGLGHRKILFASPAVRAVVRYLTGGG
jgi:pimeloyl-ACP methyl ester carboxylesterase